MLASQLNGRKALITLQTLEFLEAIMLGHVFNEKRFIETHRLITVRTYVRAGMLLNQMSIIVVVAEEF